MSDRKELRARINALAHRGSMGIQENLLEKIRPESGTDPRAGSPSRKGFEWADAITADGV